MLDILDSAQTAFAYDFAHNITLAEVREIVAEHNAELGMNCFIEADRGDLAIFNYLVHLPGSFPPVPTNDPARARVCAILRELRGLTFDKETGRIVARKFQKFFNVNEKPETQVGVLDFSRPHVILEKLDGSMITPYLRRDGVIEWHTKMGATDVAKQVVEFVARNRQYEDFAQAMIEIDATPIFEWCSRQQRIVIDYPVDRLVLTAIRDNATGAYSTRETMMSLAEINDIPIVRMIPGTAENIADMIDHVRQLKNAEGYIIRFDDGHMLKIKAEEYCLIHKTKETLQFEKDVWALALSDARDDVKALMDSIDREAFEEFEHALYQSINAKANGLVATVADLRTRYADKKALAAHLTQSALPIERGLLFSIWDGKDAVELVTTLVLKNIGTSTKVAEIKAVIDGPNWNDFRPTHVMDGD